MHDRSCRATRRLVATGLTLEDDPARGRRGAKLHLLDTLGCGLAAHATGVAGEGRAAMAELGGEPQATVIGLDERLPARERRIRERDALPRPRLRRHALRFRQPRHRR